MRLRSLFFFACASAAVLSAGACNLIFSIEPGEPTGGGGEKPDGGGPGGGGTGGTGGTSGSTSSTTTSSTGSTTSCTPNTVACEGAVLHACDENGKPKADVTCDEVALCDQAAGACLDAAALPRLSIGNGRACAIEDDGSVRCWGINSGGILVPGDHHLTVPIAASITGVMQARRIAVGSGQVCVVIDDGTVVCWGSNDSGETGVPVGSATGPAKVNMPGGVPAVEVGAAHRCSCARLTNGTVACWGQHDTGCFGDASQDSMPDPTPKLIPGVAGAVQIEVDVYGSPTCARLASGKVMCWGINTTPKEIVGVSDAVDVAVARGTIVIRSSSQGLMWSVPMPNGFTDAVAYGVTGTVRSIAGGDAFCVLGDDDSIRCALVGNPPPSNPTPVPGLPAGKIVEIAAGYSLSYGLGLQCLRLEGTPLASRVYCWGDDYGHALGAGAPSSVPTPQPVTTVTNAESISASHTSTTVVLSTGAVVAWGQTSSFPGSSSASPKTVTVLGNDNDVVHTQDIERLGYIVKKTGNLALFDSGSPVTGKRLLKVGGSNFAEARNFARFDIARTTGGSLIVYGDDAHSNDSGIFGDGTNTATADTFATVPGLTNVIAFAAHANDYGVEPAHACVILSSPNGAVRCWGNNYYGECGIGSTSPSVNAPAAVTIPNGETAVSIAVGAYFSCASTGVGSVYCWGRNDSGQLGLDPGTPEISFPVQITGISTAVGVTARESHVCAWLTDGTMVCWGGNWDGQLGDGTFEDTYIPAPVMGVSNVADASAGPGHTCARHADGKVTCWGSSYNGQVGTGVVGVFPSPRMVLGL